MIEPLTTLSMLTEARSLAAIPAVKKVLDNLSDRLLVYIGNETQLTYDKIVVNLRLGFSDYLSSSYVRCEKFKTLLDSSTPLKLIDHYVFVTLTCNNVKTKDVDLINVISLKNSVVIVGLAGSGKSMFMKYLTLCKYLHPDGKLPLFIDLRAINSISSTNLLTFLRINCTKSSNPISESQFELVLKSGSVILILDGFDEVNLEKRDSLERDIMDIRHRFPDVPVVVSSRPDERFGSWSSFFVYKVDALSKEQCIHLIETLEYDVGVKKRFLNQVKTNLYDSHTSFLSSPLLTTIMLLTYEEFANIPQQMYAFYSQAFDTLFQKHDAQKQQFSRKFHTGMTKEEFKACFSSFCAMTYLEERYSFDDSYLHRVAEKAILYTKDNNVSSISGVTSKQFLDDLTGSVCMLHQDGLEIAFVHRSFQEYFAALFIATSRGEKVRMILDRYAMRFGDSVIPMALEMSRESVEQEWVLPTVERLQKLLFDEKYSDNCAIQYSKMFPALGFHRTDLNIMPLFDQVEMSVFGSIEAFRNCYPVEFNVTRFPGFMHLEDSDWKKILGPRSKGGGENAAKIRSFYALSKKNKVSDVEESTSLLRACLTIWAVCVLSVGKEKRDVD